jgi:hypothetical protein
MPSDEERLDHECQMTRLELWCLTQWLAQHPEESAAFVLRERTNIFLRSDLYDGRPFRQVDWTDPRWLELEEGLCRLLEECLGRSDTADFEERGLAIFRPTIERRLALDAERPRKPRFSPQARVCGSLWFTPPTGGPEAGRLFFHIFNALQPGSIFDDPNYVPGCLLTVMAQADRDFGCDRLWTISWLNSYPRWQSFFPEEWRRDMGPEKTVPQAGLHFWGQFVNARGTFNAKHAAQFRQTGRVPYPVRQAECTFAALRAHIRKVAPRAEAHP